MWAANWQKFTELSRSEQWWLVQAFLALPVVGLGLRLWGLRRLQVLLSRWPLKKPPGLPPEQLIAVARAQSRLVQAAARHGWYRPSCLPRSLALWWVLKGHGIETDLRVGVKPAAHALEAHAWVELQGQPLNDDPDVHRHFPPFGRAIAP